MSNSVNPVGIQNAPPAPASTNAPAAPAAAAAQTSAQPDFKSQLPSTVQVAAPHDADTPISPRIVVDPLAGPITEFLTTSGAVQAQIPSAAVVAYLRAGLTAEGFAKPTPTEPHPDKTNVVSNNSNNNNSTSGASTEGGKSVVA